MPLDNFTASSPPTPSDDSTQGYSRGSRWMDGDDYVYVCVDASPNQAVWHLQVSVALDSGTVLISPNGDPITLPLEGGNLFAHEVVSSLRPNKPDNSPQTSLLVKIHAGTDAPDNNDGDDGSYYFRANGSIYHKQSGAWVQKV